MAERLGRFSELRGLQPDGNGSSAGGRIENAPEAGFFPQRTYQSGPLLASLPRTTLTTGSRSDQQSNHHCTINKRSCCFIFLWIWHLSKPWSRNCLREIICDYHWRGIQGVEGSKIPTTEFMQELHKHWLHTTILILNEIQGNGYRTVAAVNSSPASITDIKPVYHHNQRSVTASNNERYVFQISPMFKPVHTGQLERLLEETTWHVPAALPLWTWSLNRKIW